MVGRQVGRWHTMYMNIYICYVSCTCGTNNVHVGQTMYMYLVYIYDMYHVHVGQTMYMYLVYIYVIYHVHVGQTMYMYLV